MRHSVPRGLLVAAVATALTTAGLTAATTAVASAPSAVGTGGLDAAVPAVTTAARRTTVTGWSTTAVVRPTRTAVLRVATVSGPVGRAVLLQRAAATGTAWRTVVRRKTDRSHRVAFTVTAWTTPFRYRLLVPAVAGWGAVTTPAVAVRAPGLRPTPSATATPTDNPEVPVPPSPSPSATGPTAPAADGVIDTTDRAAVVTAYRDRYLPTRSVSVSWTGSVDGCRAGAPGAGVEAAQLQAINYYRSQAGLGPVTLDPALSAKAQQMALMISANRAIDHHPASTWTCWSATGSEAASHSNLAWWSGYRDSPASRPIDMYVDDGDVPSLGHRTWVLNAAGRVVGSGTSDIGNALWVIDPRNGGDVPAGTPTSVPWPNAGYIPQTITPTQYWSVTFPMLTTVKGTSVRVTGPDGAPVPVSGLHEEWGYGTGVTLIWEMPGVDVTATTDRTYTVTLSGFESLSYRVTVTAV